MVSSVKLAHYVVQQAIFYSIKLLGVYTTGICVFFPAGCMPQSPSVIILKAHIRKIKYTFRNKVLSDRKLEAKNLYKYRTTNPA